jgi:hypothetical protein
MNACIFKCRDTRRRFPRHPIRVFIVGLPTPSDRLAWIRLPDRRIVRRGRHNAPGDLAKCFAHKEGMERHKRKLKKRDESEREKTAAQAQRFVRSKT